MRVNANNRLFELKVINKQFFSAIRNNKIRLDKNTRVESLYKVTNWKRLDQTQKESIGKKEKWSPKNKIN